MANITKNEVYVIYEESSSGGESKSDEEYSSHEDTHCYFNVEGVFIGENQGYIYTETVKVDFDPDKVTDVYVVYGRYTTGDSFGTTYGKGHISGVYDTYEKAKKAKTLLEEIYGLYHINSSFSSKKNKPLNDKLQEWCQLNNIKDASVYSVGPWHGYFESLEEINIEVFPIKRYK
jgi:hypothetical protein